MSALGSYISACRFAIAPKCSSENYFTLMHEYITQLRFYLACRVCDKLLQEPMTPDHTACQHTVCKNCLGGKMRLKPACGWCQSYENFAPNKLLSMLLKCYPRLCNYIRASAVHELDEEGTRFSASDVEKLKQDSSECIEAKVFSLLEEGCRHCVQDAGASLFNSKPLGCDFLSSRSCDKLSIANNGASNRSQKEDPHSVTKVTSETSHAAVEVDATASRDNRESESVKKRPKKSKIEKKGCGCGTATANPGKLTCYGQRCPCYSNHNPCMDCRCRGCRNPNRIVKIEQISDDTDNDQEISVV